MDKQDELIQKIAELQKELNHTKEIAYVENVKNNKEKLDILRENKSYILSLFEHSRTSCSDENPTNSYSDNQGYARCNKCHLMEILNGYWGDEFEVKFDISISKIVK